MAKILRDFVKDPDDQLDYTFDFRAETNGNGDSDWLESGENIASSTLDVPNDLTLVQKGETSDAVTAWLSGGNAGESYIVLCKITTDNSPARTVEFGIKINVSDQV